MAPAVELEVNATVNWQVSPPSEEAQLLADRPAPAGEAMDVIAKTEGNVAAGWPLGWREVTVQVAKRPDHSTLTSQDTEDRAASG